MPRPPYAHSSSWDQESSPFVRRVRGVRQRSKLWIPPPPLRQSSLAFTRATVGRRVRSKRFTPRIRRNPPHPPRAELGFPPPLISESIAHPPFSTASDTRVSYPGPPELAEPSLLRVESTATTTLCGFRLRADALVFVPRKPFSCLRADVSVFLPRKYFLRDQTPFLLKDNSTLRADAARFVPTVASALPLDPGLFPLPNSHLFPPCFHPSARPNSDPRVNLATPDAGGLPRVQSSLNRDAWAHFLRDYPDPVFVESLLHIIDHGANIGFTGDRLVSQASHNLPSASLYPHAVTDAISTQLSKGRIAGPFSEPPFPYFRSSPLGVAVRKRSGKLRQIHHLSWPRGRSVNDGIPDSDAAISYDMFNRAVDDLIRSGPGSQMIKLDLEQAFRHIPIRPDDWPLLGYSWKGNIYHELFLMFGLRSAPYIFNLFSEGLHWILQHHLPAQIRHYLDDFLKIFCPDTPLHLLHAALSWTRSLAQALGLNFQDSKVEGPTTVLEFLGLILDSVRMEARLPADKLTYLRDFLLQWDVKSHCTLKELAELTGYLLFCSQVIPYSRAFLRSMFGFSSTFKSAFSRRRISCAVRRDLRWWSTFSSSWNGVHLLAPEREILHVYTDASGTKGAGGVLDNDWFSIRMPHRYAGAKRDIQFKEFYAIIHAILCWGPKFSGRHIIFHTDNQDVDSAIRNLSIRSTPTMELVRQFIGLACRLDFTFESVWLPTKENGIADAASRYQFSRMFELAPHLSRTSSSKVISITNSNLESSLSRPFASL